MEDQKKVAAAVLWLAATLITGCAEMPRMGTEPQGTATVAGGAAPSETDDGTEALLDDASDASSDASSPHEAAPRLVPASASRGAVTRWASGRKRGDGGGAGPRLATRGSREEARPEPPALDPSPINIEKMRGTETLPAGEPDAELVEAAPAADEGAPDEVDSQDADASTDPPAEVLPEGTEPREGETEEAADQVQELEEADRVQEIEEPDSDPVPEIEEPDPVQDTE